MDIFYIQKIEAELVARGPAGAELVGQGRSWSHRGEVGRAGAKFFPRKQSFFLRGKVFW